MSDAQLNVAARGLLAAIHSEPVVWTGQNIACTVSIGYANFPIKGAAVPIALERAIVLVDKALRQAQLQGGDRACLIGFVSADNDGELSAINKQFVPPPRIGAFSCRDRGNDGLGASSWSIRAPITDRSTRNRSRRRDRIELRAGW